ncbi:MAG: UDP-glucose/GDP-mannose dehydrogenase family protein [Phycisphaerae bacterium]|nr:UDP-glucose/GDP-mannose dehydrogenase family protein [Phycisphaerae bacterium]
MKISIFGLGYVGCVSMACLADDGNRVVGVDVSISKVNLINAGSPSIVEKDVDGLIKKGWEAGNIEATDNYKTALRDADVSIICVGTPNNKSGHLDLTRIHAVAQDIGEALAESDRFHVVLIRSTVVPGTNEKVGTTIEERSGKKRRVDFEVVSNPEFLREGTAVQDFYNPPVTVIGTSSNRAFEIAKSVYRKVDAPVRKTSIAVAETIKLVNNSFHALKVTFANEVGSICKQLGIDSHEVMDLFCQDRKLNLSACYLKPGFAYGGSCLPKDLRALRLIAHDNYVDTPVINAIEPSNKYQKQRLVDMITETGIKKIGILGFSFKPGTDDLRESPIVEIAEILLGKGYDLKVHDKNVHLSNLIGRNKQYVNEKIPHLEKIITDDLDEVINNCDLIIVANKEEQYADLPSRYPGKDIIDLVRIEGGFETSRGRYQGFCW